VALYASRRVGQALVIVLCAMAVLFGMIHPVPGDPITIALGPRATEAMRQAYLARMRLDQPVYLQFLAFAGGVLRGDLGADVLNRQGRPRGPDQPARRRQLLVARQRGRR